MIAELAVAQKRERFMRGAWCACVCRCEQRLGPVCVCLYCIFSGMSLLLGAEWIHRYTPCRCE